MSQKLYDKLEKYEQDAYDGGFGSDWLSDVGEGFKFFLEKCVKEGRHATIKGFENYIDNLAKEKFSGD